METAVYCSNCQEIVIPNMIDYPKIYENGQIITYKNYYCSKCGFFIKEEEI